MAMWWWDDPVFIENTGNTRIAQESTLPLTSAEINRYAAWLACELEINDVLKIRKGKDYILGDEERFEESEITREVLKNNHSSIESSSLKFLSRRMR